MHRLLAVLLALTIASFASLSASADPEVMVTNHWQKLYGDNPNGWAGRAGLQAVELNRQLYVMGGRTPNPQPTDPFASVLWSDVWKSGDYGQSWQQVEDNAWPERAYFQAVSKNGTMYVMGGQNLKSGPPPVCPPGILSCSDFFNDIWTSVDGTNWKPLPMNGPRWEPRAGFSAIVFNNWIYVLGGSQGDDVAIGGSGRVLYNDVWRSRNGLIWQQVTDNAEWSPRAGAALVAKNGYLYLLGGEDAFLCTPGPGGLECPYFNDVWRSSDGATWELVTEAAGWSPRPGHQCQVLDDKIICFGGFGWPVPKNPNLPPSPNNLKANHPNDMWASRNGKNWYLLPYKPWNASSSAEVKYDFDSLVLRRGPGRHWPSIFTFGGDREISFINADPAAVDDDVWRFWLR